MLTPLLILSLVATPLPETRGSEPSGRGAASTPAPALRIPQATRPAAPAHEAPRWVSVTTNVLLMEMLFAGTSALAGRYPERTGWTLVGISPIFFANMQSPDAIAPTSVFAAGTVALGLWDALELRGARYSGTERFWWNFAAWHVISLGMEITGRLTGPDGNARSPPALSFAAGPVPGGVRLALLGRF